jgi:hypothetical protein
MYKPSVMAPASKACWQLSNVGSGGGGGGDCSVGGAKLTEVRVVGATAAVAAAKDTGKWSLPTMHRL